MGIEDEAPAEPPSDNRVINAWISDVDGQAIPPGRPLLVGNGYDLKFNIDAPRSQGRAGAPIDVAKLFQSLSPEQQTIEILVVVETGDFTIGGLDQQILAVARTGRSKNTATFYIEPEHNGEGVIRVFFYANNRVFQRLTIAFQVGQPAMDMQVSGITMGAVSLPPRRPALDLRLSIVKQAAGYQFALQGGGSGGAFVNLTEAQLAEAVARVRETLKEVVFTQAGGQYVYQVDDTSISADVHRASLKALARAGFELYEKLFYGPGSQSDAHDLGDLLRRISRQNRLAIQIEAENFAVPWALLYDRDDLQPDFDNVDAEGFWGFKHVVAHMPRFRGAPMAMATPQIAAGDRVALAFVSNRGIDSQMRRPIIEGQSDFFRAMPDISVTEYPSTTDLYNLLNDADTPAQLLYFYCHSVNKLPGETGGVAGSKFVLTDGPLTLADLEIFAPASRPPLKQAPLVFLNATQSARLSPSEWYGLLPYLMSRGARGAIGTEVDIPAMFAAEFAKEFLTRFVKGEQTLGELLLDLRREYLLNKNNVMGLVYALYGSADIAVQRGS